MTRPLRQTAPATGVAAGSLFRRRDPSLPPQPPAIGVVQRCLAEDGGAFLPQDVDDEGLAVMGKVGADIAKRNALADEVPKTAGGDMADDHAVLQDRLVADHVGARLDLQHGETLFWTGL